MGHGRLIIELQTWSKGETKPRRRPPLATLIWYPKSATSKGQAQKSVIDDGPRLDLVPGMPICHVGPSKNKRTGVGLNIPAKQAQKINKDFPFHGFTMYPSN